MEISIDEFKEQYFPALQSKFHQDTTDFIVKNMDQIKKSLRGQMDMFVNLVVRLQQELPVEIGMIQVALLNTSLYLGRPQIAYTAYNRDGYFGQELLTVKRDAGWLFEAWDDYKASIENKVAELHAENCIRSEAVRQLAWESFPFLQTCLYVTSKYIFRDIEQFPEFGNMILNPNFCMRIGAYMDWGKVVYVRRNEADIFFDVHKKDFSFYRFHKVVYSHKVFQYLDLSSTVFTECEFVYCKFENVILNDAWFRKCRIYYCTFENVKLLGLTLEQTTMKKTTFQNCTTSIDGTSLPPKDMDDIYRPIMTIDCTIDEESKIRGEA
jgi:hypothetical protein